MLAVWVIRYFTTIKTSWVNNICMDMTAKKINPYRGIFAEFVDNASFLWVLRNRQLCQPHVTLLNIQELDTRINANLDGLMISLSDSWELLEEAAQFEQGGEAFAMAATAFRSGDMRYIQRATEFGLLNTDTFKGLISALAWLPGTFAHPWIKQFFSSKNLDHKHIAIAACSLRREDPALHLNQILSRDDCKAHLPLYARCLRLIGELKRQDLAAELAAALTHENPEVAFWAHWSSILLGNKGLAEALKPFATTENPLQSRALQLAFRTLPTASARLWISELAGANANRAAIKACGILGDPLAIEWLVSHMENHELARVAGEAFYLITGENLELQALNRTAPAEFIAAQDEQEGIPEHQIEDDNLPWPDPLKVRAKWQTLQEQFTPGQRYFLGNSLHSASLQAQLPTAPQTLRLAMALHIAVLNPATPLENCATHVRTLS